MAIFEDSAPVAPDYMYAADIHQVANGKASVLDPTEWVKETADFGKFAVSAVARAVVSTLNTVPSVANIFGADMQEIQTDAVLNSFDSNLGAYYSANRDTIDVVGDVAAMMVPGMAGIKGINYAQKSLSTINAGKSVGANLAKSFGTLPDLGAKYAAQASAKMAETGNVFKLTDANTLKAFASNYAQGAVEMAAFEVAAATTMNNSPLFKDHTVTDILANAALGGSIVGAGIMGTVASVQTYGQLRRATDHFGKLLAPFRFAKGTEEGLDDFVHILNLRREKMNPAIPEETGFATQAEYQAASRALEKRQRDLGIEIQNRLTSLSGGDAEVGNAMSKMLDQMDNNKAWAAMLSLKETTRLGTIGKLELEAQKAVAAGKETNVVQKYIRIWGEDAGAVYNSQPEFLRLADTVANEKELLSIVAREMKTQPVMGNQWTPIGQSGQAVESRYIHAFSQPSLDAIENGMHIGGKDLPFLEAALHKQVGATVDGIYMDAQTLKQHIIQTKKKLGDDLADAIAIDPTVSSASVAKALNVKQGVLEGKGYPAGSFDHFFATTPADMLTKPTLVKALYDGMPVGVEGAELAGMAAIKQLQEAQQIVNEQAAAAVLGDAFARLVKITDDKVLAATPRGAGAGLMSMASGEYGTLGSIVEQLGKVTSEAKQAGHTAISERFQAPAYKLLNDSAAHGEIAVLRQAVLQTGEKYILAEREGVRRMVLREIDDYERQVIAGKNPVEPDYADFAKRGIPTEIAIKQDSTWEYMQTLVEHNNQYLGKEKVLRNAVGKGMGNWEGAVYFPQPSSKTHPYFTFVVPKNPWQQEQVSMIWARTPEELKTLESSVPQSYRLINKGDTEAYYKAQKTYDIERGMNSRDFISEMQRTGVAAPFIPKTDVAELIQDTIAHYKQVGDKQIRDAVSLHNSVAFSELRRMDGEFLAARNSKRAGSGEAVGTTPYESYVKTALDIPRSSAVPVWTELNALAENVVTRVWNTMKGSMREPKSAEDMAALNKHFDDAGFRGIKDAYTEMIANHPADKRVLSEFVQSANGLFSTLILRTDPMNALNNGVGNLVLTGSETQYLTRLIKGKQLPEADSFLRDLSEVKLPGSDTYIKSPTKLIARAYESFAKYLSGDVEAAARMETFKANGWQTGLADQLKSSFELLSLTGKETSSELTSRIKAMMKNTGDFLETASGNKLAESMNRYVSAHIADDIAQAGIKYAGLAEDEALAFVNTFVNRTQGNYIASQRPLMFQGPIGQSISLFMTYQFNMMQHIFRHMSSEGGRKNAAVLLGLQTSVYGMNGLPAFNFMNEHLVGNAAGNTSHRDAYSVGMDIPGIGDWLLYGGLSNATGLGLYSRGDMNPRHLTLVPTSITDIPFVSATTSFLGAMGKAASQTAAGGSPISSFLQGIEHAGVSRPLAGLAQALNGMYRGEGDLYSTTTKGNILYEQDLYSLATLGRVAGARPLDESIARDAYYRVQVYEGKDKKATNTLGAAIQSKVNANEEITDSDIDSFMQSYLRTGKDAATFAQFYQRQVKNAGQNQIAKLVQRGNSSYGQYMQQLMMNLDSDAAAAQSQLP